MSMDESADGVESSQALTVATNGGGMNAGALVTREESKANQLTHFAGVARTSSLHAPIMKLEGHSDAVLGCDFSPDGQRLLSCSADNRVFLWSVYGETVVNYGVLDGHKNAVLEARWSADGRRIVSCSADKRATVWDAETGQRVRKLWEHQSYVNSCDVSGRAAASGDAVPSEQSELYVTASDDRTVRVWDHRQRRAARVLRHAYEVTAVCFDGPAERVASGSLDNVIRVFDWATANADADDKLAQPSIELRGHSDTVTGLALSPDGTQVLSNAMDCTARVWDIRPYCPGERCAHALVGHQHTAEKNLLRCAWSPDGARIAAGSGDRHCYVWSLASQKVEYRLPGHKGSVNAVVFHPKEPIIASAGSDNCLFIGELQA